ncbi:alpha/beta-hydrolase [Hypoxylon sp. FL1284]|nr:alpha/beta-hydrolase [Hypoxylon sp. FL1284]
MSKLSILLVPGSFSLPKFYDPVIQGVAKEGYEIRALHLPSVGLETGPRPGQPPTMYDDAAFIAKEALHLVEQGRDVVIVTHSYGGVPGTEAVRGLAKEGREKLGQKGGIVRLAYMTSLVPAVGVAAAGVREDVPKNNRVALHVDENGWMYHADISQGASLSFSDVPRDEGEASVRKLTKHSAVSFTNPLTYPGYKDVPVSYLLCEDDLSVPAEIQKKGIDMIQRESGKDVDVVAIKAGHFPPISKPQQVVEWILHVLAQSKYITAA